MISSRPRSIRFKRTAGRTLALALLLATTAAPRRAHAQTISADAGWRDVTLDEYRRHLEDLEGVVAACQEQRESKAELNVRAQAASVQNPYSAEPVDSEPLVRSWSA